MEIIINSTLKHTLENSACHNAAASHYFDLPVILE